VQHYLDVQTLSILEFNLRLSRDEFLLAYASFADNAGGVSGIGTGLSLGFARVGGRNYL